VKKDPWNIIEHYYTPDVDFVYFECLDELENKIKGILNNWESYQPMIESAYNKSLNYTTKKLFGIIKNNHEWEGRSNR